MYYTGVGSRECPSDILDLITQYATVLNNKGYILRSGGALGADSAFQSGSTNHEIYLPWEGFNGLYADSSSGFINPEHLSNYPEALSLASTLHPAWNKLSPGARKLHTRNVYQVLGLSLDNPSKALICWALPDKYQVVKGGTGLAVRLALKHGVPVCNLYFAETVLKTQAIIKRSTM